MDTHMKNVASALGDGKSDPATSALAQSGIAGTAPEKEESVAEKEKDSKTDKSSEEKEAADKKAEDAQEESGSADKEDEAKSKKDKTEDKDKAEEKDKPEDMEVDSAAVKDGNCQWNI